ncbi:MAG: hypothetical protein AAFX85_17715, partial [Pseudomonadota bacterium]
MDMNTKKLCGALLAAPLMLVAQATFAVTVTGEVLRDEGDLYSFYLEEAELPPPPPPPPGNPMGPATPTSPDAFFFSNGATIEFDFT